MELVDDFAFPLPITVIAELLGIPVEDRERFRAWSSNVVVPALTPEVREIAKRRGDEFIAYLDDLFAQRRAEPTDDLVSALVLAEDGGDHLSENELYSMVVLLIVAGHETTVSLIANAVHTLLTHIGGARGTPRRPVAHAVSRRGAAALRQPGRADDHALGRGGRRARRAGASAWRPRHRGHRLGEPRRRPVPRRGQRSTSHASTTSTSASDAVRTTASARRSRASRPRSRWRRSSAAPESPARDRRGRSLLAADPALPQPRVAPCRLGRVGRMR